MRCNAYRQWNIHGLRLAVCLLCLTLALLHSAGAAELDRVPDPTQLTSLTIRYDNDGSLPDDVTFRLFLVASVDADISFKPVSPFDQYSIELRSDMSSGEWQSLADTLASYVEADGLQPAETQHTVRCTATFSELRAGLYLVLGRSVEMDGQVYTPKPTLIVLPNRQSNGWWQYNVEMTPKWEIGPPEYGDLQVMKVWDDNDADDRPESVTIELYCDGVLEETITLSKENNWRHTWTGLNTRFEWTVVERPVPDGYTVTITEENGLIVVKNVRTYPPDDPDDPDIPQTGIDWTPVMLLAAVGSLLFMAGWIRRRESDKEEA